MRTKSARTSVPWDTLAKIDAWISRQPAPQPKRSEAIRRLVERGLKGLREDRADAFAERAEEARADAAQARIDHEKAQIAEDEKTASLRRVRLAKEEHDRRVASGEQKPPKRVERGKKLVQPPSAKERK